MSHIFLPGRIEGGVSMLTSAGKEQTKLKLWNIHQATNHWKDYTQISASRLGNKYSVAMKVYFGSTTNNNISSEIPYVKSEKNKIYADFFTIS